MNEIEWTGSQPAARKKFKRGDIVKRFYEPGGVDYYHVEDVHNHENGNQGLDVIGDKNGKRYGLSSRFTHHATLRELVDYRESRK